MFILFSKKGIIKMNAERKYIKKKDFSLSNKPSPNIYCTRYEKYINIFIKMIASVVVVLNQFTPQKKVRRAIKVR